ncbi:BT_3928 family protein [Sphingobacterium sp.]|uniref:BT_3928 family protein n=1 Tax=Sphingobacterium sp. TaxID=341027 RepID=UPI0028AFECE8|nr:BT_3928 family protein [Sphingobacterium sp.]
MTYTQSYSQTKQPKPNVLLWIARILVGLLFIFSGLIKANDPMGFGYKLQEYFHVLNLGFLSDYATWIAIFLCAVEIILGGLLILGVAGKKVAWGLLLLIIFFTFLTFYSAFFEVVKSCGCFGDAIPLTPWQSFFKDLILLLLIVYIFVKRDQIKPFIRSLFTRNLLTALIILGSFGIGIYTYYFLPFIDFLPYKEGNNVPELMKAPEGAEPDVFEHIYELKNKTTNETKKVTDKEYMGQKLWEDENWEVVGDPQTRLIKKGYEVKIPDLIITDMDGTDRTEEVIQNPYYNFIVVSTDLKMMSPFDLAALDRVNTTIRDLSEDYNIRAVLATASSSDEVNYLNDQMDLVLETFYVDAVPLKSMVRANPGVMLMLNGTVVKKWSQYNFPSKHELITKYLDKVE